MPNSIALLIASKKWWGGKFVALTGSSLTISNMPKKILIIEDEEIMFSLLEKRLKGEGYDIQIARDGQAGLAMMRQEKPDLVLLDIIMPKMNGFDVLEAMRADSSLKDVSAIIISNSGQSVELDRAKELGVKDWLIKTEFDIQEVLAKVKKQLNL